MAKRDLYHNQVKHALIKDGWTITHDPFALEIGDRRLEAEMGPERLISAEKGVRKIVVEIKSFLGRSPVNDLEQALGQYMLYQRIIEHQRIDRELYLAVPTRTFETIFTVPLGQILLSPQLMRVIVFDDHREEIVSWIPAEPIKL